jgi:hypothetical protein
MADDNRVEWIVGVRGDDSVNRVGAVWMADDDAAIKGPTRDVDVGHHSLGLGSTGAGCRQDQEQGEHSHGRTLRDWDTVPQGESRAITACRGRA